MKGCEFGFAPSCNDIANYYVKGLGVEKSDEIAFKLYNASCKLNDESGCYNRGVSYQRGLGIEKNLDNAIKDYVFSCDKNFAYACLNLGLIQIKKNDMATGKSLIYKALLLKPDNEAIINSAKEFGIKN